MYTNSHLLLFWTKKKGFGKVIFDSWELLKLFEWFFDHTINWKLIQNSYCSHYGNIYYLGLKLMVHLCIIKYCLKTLVH